LDAAKAIVRDFGKGQDLESVTAGFVSIYFENRVVDKAFDGANGVIKRAYHTTYAKT